jgi:hypothetical protein
MRLTYANLYEIEKAFELKNGAWTREAVTYLGLSYPLKKGWKQFLVEQGTPPDAPIAQGIKIDDWRWTSGEDIFFEDDDDTYAQEALSKKDPTAYVKRQLNTLEDAINDLRKQADGLREKVKELRNLVSEDDF